MKVVLYVDIWFEPVIATIYCIHYMLGTVEKYNIFYII